MAAGVLLVLVLASIASLFVGPYDPNEQLDPYSGRYRPPFTTLQVIRLDNGTTRLAEGTKILEDQLHWTTRGRQDFVPLERVQNLENGSLQEERFFLMGSDKLGRDVFSRWLHGARISLMVASLVVLLATLIGLVVGTLAALGPRWLDTLLMRFADGLLAFPWIFLIITLATLFPSSIRTLVLLLGTTTWMGVSRLVRADIQSLLQRDFVLAARTLGADPLRVFLRHLLPNLLPTLLVAAPLRIGSVILSEASLSFLGMGIQPPESSWGNMIADGREATFYAWWVPTFPAIALVATMLSLNLLSDGIRDWWDPRASMEARAS